MCVCVMEKQRRGLTSVGSGSEMNPRGFHAIVELGQKPFSITVGSKADGSCRDGTDKIRAQTFEKTSSPFLNKDGSIGEGDEDREKEGKRENGRGRTGGCGGFR